jgi:hypothetical protein
MKPSISGAVEKKQDSIGANLSPAHNTATTPLGPPLGNMMIEIYRLDGAVP